MTLESIFDFWKLVLGYVMLLFTAISLKSLQKTCVTDTESKQESKIHIGHEHLVFPQFAGFMA